MTDDCDFFVVGGGPAGLAVAIAGAQRGLRVTVADGARPPIDKACGEGIMPDGVLALRRMGVELSGIDAVPFAGIHFVDAAGETSAPFVDGAGLGMRRIVLHRLLVAKAESLGVELRWGTPVEAVREGAVTVGGRMVQSKFVVCADGFNSRVRRMVGLVAGKEYRRRYGFRMHYKVRPWSRFVEVHWADCGQMYVTPLGEEATGVVFITSNSRMRLDEALPAFPRLYARLRGATQVGKPIGGVTGTCKLREVVRGNVVLVGDASGSADAVTGDGLSLAFQQAECLAEAMCEGDLRSYAAAHRSIGRLPRIMGELMLVMNDHPWVRRRMFGAFARSPEMFGKLLAVHTRKLSPFELGVCDYVSFGWSVLRA